MSKIDIRFTVSASLLAAVAEAQSQDDTRYYICAVKFESAPNATRMIATNGHFMSVALDTTQASDNKGEIPKNGLLITVPKRLITAAKRYLTATWESGVWRLSGPKGDDVFIGNLIDGTFPNWAEVFKSAPNHAGEPNDDTGISVRLLNIIMKTAKHLQPNSEVAPPRITQTVTGAAFSVQYDGTEFFASVAMPARAAYRPMHRNLLPNTTKAITKPKTKQEAA